MNTRVSHKREKGQAIIETALVIVLLLVIFVGMEEFARAWYTKGSIKNAVRQGARVACVTPSANFDSNNTSFVCRKNTRCPNNDGIINAVCCQPGVKPSDNNTTVTVTVTCIDGTTEISCGEILPNGTIKVDATYSKDDFFIVGGAHFSFLGLTIWPWPTDLVFSTSATMRYE